MPAYASLRSAEPVQAAAEAEQAVAAGFGAVKVKIGHGPLAADLAAIHAVRDRVGTAVEIMVDYNQSLTVAEALRRLPVLDAEGLTWIEEPVAADDPAGHAHLRRLARTPIQLGENWHGTREMAANLAVGASDLVMLDVMNIGGVTGWLAAAALAESAGLPISSHLFPQISAHLLAATSARHWLEYLDFAQPLLATPTTPAHGQLTASPDPGCGLDWDDEALQAHLVTA